LGCDFDQWLGMGGDGLAGDSGRVGGWVRGEGGCDWIVKLFCLSIQVASSSACLGPVGCTCADRDN
jgi:hypothetical protein